MQSFTTPPITVFGQAAQPCALDRSSYSRRRERKSTAEAGFFISIQFYFEQKRDRRDVSLIPFLRKTGEHSVCPWLSRKEQRCRHGSPSLVKRASNLSSLYNGKTMRQEQTSKAHRMLSCAFAREEV